jgi:hypothetical protein
MEGVEEVHEETEVFFALGGLLVTGHSVTFPEGLEVEVID